MSGVTTHKKGLAQPPKFILVIIWVVVGICIIGLVATIGILVSKRATISGVKFYPIAADAQDVWPRSGETVRVKIYPDCLSGWINLPKGVNFMIDAPGEIEYFFWSGKRVLVKNKNTKWLEPAEIPDCSFQLRGTTGEASITVQ